MVKNKYAVIMTATGDFKFGANAFLNSLDYYGNKELDYYLINDFEPDYIEKVRAFDFPVIDVRINQLNYDIPSNKNVKGWKARFFRWKFATEIASKYDVLLIVDADMVCMNNIMQYFKIAKDTGYIIVVNNPIGYSLEHIQKNGIEGVRGAASPPVHCMPIFIDGKRYQKFLEKIWENGISGDLGDMSTLFRTLYWEKLLGNLFRLPNALWIQTWWYHDLIEKKGNYLYCANERMNMFHGKWWISKNYQKAEEIKESNLIDFGRKNIRLFFEQYKKFNTQWKVNLDFPS